MALYQYQAFSKDGSKQRGQIDASSERGARDLLVRRGLFPTVVVPYHKALQEERFLSRLFSRGISLKEKILFTKQLAILLRSAVPLVQAIELLVDQFQGKMHRVLVSVRDELQEGETFADTLKQYPHLFENVYVQLVRAGEASGKLEVILDRLVEYLEQREALRRKVTSALTYPAIQFVIVILVAVGLMTFVVPQLASTFASKGAQLPATTQWLLWGSDILVDHYFSFLFFLFSFFIGFIYWKSTERGAFMLDKIKLKTPIIGFFARIGAVVQFSRTLGMLLEAGVNFSKALTIVCDIIDNRILTTALDKARENIVKQGKIAEYLKETHIFPPIATYLIRTGEESGHLDAMLLTVAQNYEQDLAETADTLSTLIEPVMMIFMAIVVGFIVMAIATPMMQMGDLAGL